MGALISVYFEAKIFSLYKLILDFNGQTFVYYINIQLGENNMTIHDLLLKLEEARSFLDGSKDEMANDAHDTINGLIYDVETDGIEGNEGYNKLSGGY